jgi:Tol biopolymer transport system component
MYGSGNAGKRVVGDANRFFLSLAFSFLLTCMLTIIPAGTAQAAAGTVMRCSTNSSGAQATGASSEPVISADGRYVAFVSSATDLVDGDTNGKGDVFRKDLQTGETVRCSTKSDGSQANGASGDVSISCDGGYVAFYSYATDLVSGDTNGEADIFRKNLVTGEILRCSTSSSSAQATGGGSYFSSMSSDGRYVAFYSDATDLVSGDTNGMTDIFRKDMQERETVRCSTDASRDQANGTSYDPCISADGRYVAFHSDATDLVGGDTNGNSDVFRKDVLTEEILRCSTSSSNTQATGGSYYASISSNGRYVAFESSASDLMNGDANGYSDIFRKDLQTGETLCCSTDASGTQADDYSDYPSLSADGRFVALMSKATNLVDGDSNAVQDIFRKDLQTGHVACCSSGTADDYSDDPSISADGRFVTFDSRATNLVDGDNNGEMDVFRTELAPHVISVSPTSGKVGKEVTITGTDFGATRGTSYVRFGTKTVTNSNYISWSNTHIVVKVPAGSAGAVNVKVNTTGGLSNLTLFKVVPYVSGISPKSGVQGTVVTINGSGYGATRGTSYVKFGGVKATNYVSWSATEIVVKVPAGSAGAINVSVTTGGGRSNLSPFKIIPRINKLVPKSGSPGTQVTITGTGFGGKRGTSTVKFGATVVTEYVSWSNTQIVVKVPVTGTGSKSVKVTTTGGTSEGASFTVN